MPLRFCNKQRRPLKSGLEVLCQTPKFEMLQPYFDSKRATSAPGRRSSDVATNVNNACKMHLCIELSLDRGLETRM